MRKIIDLALGTTVDVALTDDERTQLDNDRILWDNEAPAREMEMIRNHRNNLLIETDWRATSDLTMSDAWKTYRQELRDIPASNTVYADVTWPPKPE